MSPVKREWLLHGCMRSPDADDTERVSIKIRSRISELYGGKAFSIKSWPQRGFRNVWWWYEKSARTPSVVASYCLITDNSRGPNLYAGITVEKGFEDRKRARKEATQRNESIERWLLSEDWDWHRFVSSWARAEERVRSAAEKLRSELYFWLEFGDDRRDSRYYMIDQNHLYWRGGFAPVKWAELLRFATKPRPQLWGSLYLIRAFTLDECTPALSEGKLMEVFEAMRPIRDLWRGTLPQPASQ